jgi:hypothetical protein
MNDELKQHVAIAIADFACEHDTDLGDDEPVQIAAVAVKAMADWVMRSFGIAVGPRGHTGPAGAQGMSGIAHIVVVTGDSHRMMTRKEYEKTFGKLKE